VDAATRLTLSAHDRRSAADKQVVAEDLDLAAGLRRARRTAAVARALMALAGIALSLTVNGPQLPRGPAIAGFALVLATSLVQMTLPGSRWLTVEETVAPLSAVLIVGLGPERVTAVGLLWLCCVACGVLARGGRRHWSGRAILVIALALPLVRYRGTTLQYGAFFLAAIMLLLTCGRVTRELRGMHDRAREEADHDGLTGVLTRRRFRVELERLVCAIHVDPSGETRALLLIDLDHFRGVNKTSGHAAGDALLCAVARRLVAALGKRAVVGRLGGDEFGAVVYATDPKALAQRLQEGLAQDPGVQASLGVALIPDEGGDADGLLRAVDVALRIAKRPGSRGVSVYVGESLSDTGRVLESLQRLIAGDGLSVAVQPIVSAANGTVHAYEALARFSGRVASDPLYWFTLADELGMRDQLELACLAAALRVWPQRPAGALLTINLSGPLLLDSRVGAQLDAVPTLAGLIIELTENNVILDSDGLRSEITRLRARGARFAVDDVGAGYSGLRQISVLHPDYLKLDRSLVTGVDDDGDRRALISAMVGWVGQTGGYLVAEGVETAAELEALAALGVGLVQGYYLAQPGWPWPEVREPVARPPARATTLTTDRATTLTTALVSAPTADVSTVA
jgi:diguanylate cyclase (GGDEF)-like protein